MSLEQRIADDYTAALRAGDDERKATLRLVRAALKNATIDARHTLDDEEVTRVLRKEANQRADSIEQYRAGRRMDLVAAEQTELDIIESYLPQRMTAEEIEAATRAEIAAVGATGPGDMGKVMGPLMKRLGASADGSLVQATVRRLLSG